MNERHKPTQMNTIDAETKRPVTVSAQLAAVRVRLGEGGAGQPTRGLMLRVFSLLAVILALWSGVALAATVTLYPATNTPTGTVTNPTNAYANDDISADISCNSSTLTVAGFNNIDLGVISDVTAYVKYKTSAAPSNDTYAFEAAVDGSTFSTSIVAANTTNQTAYVTTAGTSFGALTWAQVGTLAIKNTTVKSAAADGYSVNWDVAYIVVTYTPDTSAPTVSSVTVQTGLTVDVTFSEAMSTGVTTASNYTVSGTGKGTLANNPNSVALVSGNTYRLTWSTGEMLNGGNITVTVANAQDSAGNTIGSPNSGTHTGGAIGVAPTVTINQAGAQDDPTGTAPINFTVVFSESVLNFATGDVTITGTAGGTKTATVTGSGTTYNVAVTGMTTAGTVIASINAGVATDAAGNPNTASTSTDNSVSWTTGPVCTRNAPAFSINPAAQNVKTGDAVIYTLTVVNNDTAECADASTFNIVITSETGDTADFMLPSVRSANSVSVAAGGTSNSAVTLTVTSAGAAVDGKALTSLLTLSDAVNHNSMNQSASVVTTVANFNPMIHSSRSTGSLKWSAQNGWGIAGGKYGEFTCATCHARKTGNIKRVKTTIAAPNGTDQFPIEADLTPPAAISFLDSRDGSSDFGDDVNRGGDTTQSDRICEVCHSQNKYHNYNTANNALYGGNLNHENQKDCISCHQHSKGFGASCTSCHGNPPVDEATLVVGALDTGSATAGAHQAHTTASIGCALCHSGSVGSGSQHNVDARVTLGFVNLPTGTGGATGGSYDGQVAVSYDASAAGTIVSSGGTSTCAVYCHGNWTGSNGQTAVVWSGGALVANDCNDCHGGSAAAPPTAGSHQTHAGNGAGDLALACNKCHPSYLDTTHLDGDVAWALDTTDSKFTASATYSGLASGTTGGTAPSAVYGTCAGLYCHSQGEGSAPIQVPQWGNAASGACGDCHNVGTAMATGKHTPHVNDGTIMANATCDDCHASTSSDGITVTGSALHVNEVKDVTINANWDSDVTASNNYTPASKTCASVYCHSSGQASPVYKSVAWTDTIIDCKACHNADVTSGSPMATGSHGAHINQTAGNQVGWNIGCADCHSTTASSNLAIGTPANHINKSRDIGIKADANKPGCSQISCHSNGNYGGTLVYQADASYEWGVDTLTGCAVCHGNGTLAYPTYTNGPGEDSNSHAEHAAYSCEECHSGTATGTSLKTGGTTLHVNQAIDVAGAKFSWASSTETCSSITCHNNGTAQWGATLSCSSCHTLPLTSGAHGQHYAAKTISGWNGTTFTNCTACHPDNSGTHSAVNGAIVVNAGLNPSGSSPAITCSTTTTGCHNGQSTPAWNTTNIACVACHTVDGANTATVANPVSGLHGNSVASVQDHDNTLTGGCEACHVKASITGHWNGVASTTADYTAAAVGVTSVGYTDAGGTGATRGTCMGTAQLGACHSDGGNWRRQWSTDADVDIVATPNPGQNVCNVCHGQSSAWNEGTSHYRSGSGATEDKGLGMHTDASPNQCEDCHAYPSAAVHNSNNKIDFSGGGASYLLKWGTHATNPGWYCGSCHDAQASEDASLTSSHTYFDSLAFPSPTRATPERITYVTGTSVPEGSCFGCHGDGVAEYWPQNVGNVRGSTTMSDYNNAGKHQKHIEVLAARLGYTLPGDDAQQKAMCAYCHGVNDGDHMATGAGQLAEVFPAGNNKSLWGLADNAAFNGTTYNCTTSDCHNNKDTTATYSWYAASTSTCTMCHTRDISGNNPSSGLHFGNTAPTVSGAWHDDSLSGGCVTCHTSLPAIDNTPASTHIDSIFQGGNGQKTQMGLFATYTQTADNVGTCATTCHNGAGDNGTWARKWDSSIHYAALAPTSFATCAGCHGGFNNDWTFSTAAGTGVGQLDNTTDGSVSHGRNWDGDANPSEVIGNHSGSTNATKCNSCHVYGDAEYLLTGAGKHHRDGNITMNSTAGYQRTTTTPNYGCTASCHSNNANHGMENSNWTLGTLAGPAMGCTTCHSGTGGGGLNVSSTSPHTIVGTRAGYNTFTGCETCHPQHTGGVLVPNETRVGINYTADGRTGFRLGGTATVGTTEAEICWNCHGNLTYQTTAISEWGVNNKQPGTPAAVTAYNWGTISGTGNWIGATWTSAQATLFSYKTGAIQSTHAANFAATTPGMDTVANIRCSYCHDVHDTYGTTGKPYLRGTWWTNPYREDGAPVSSITYTGVIPFGNVPRAQASQNQLGGYQIDQNNGNPTATGGTGTGGAWTVADSAGLCWLCHNQNRAGTAVTVDTLDWFGTNDWVTNGSGQINGHSNAVVGGTGSNRVNIFRTSWRAPSGLTTTGARPDMGYANHGTGVGYGYRGITSDTRPFTGHLPVMNSSKPYGGKFYNWGATVDDATTDTKYHNFSCSKCHNPHASRLPRLMVTNCLDTKHNTWDNVRTGITALTVSSTNNNGVTLNGTTAPDSWGRTWSNVQSAQNCHRLADPAVNPTNTTNYGRGWNNVTPW